MANAAISIEGWIANELSVREAGSKRVVDISIPVQQQKKTDNGWEDIGAPVWYKASFWEEHGDAVMQTVNKGSLVTVTGTPRLDLYLKAGAAAGSIVIDFPVLAVVVKRPKRGQSAPAPEPVWNTATTEPSSYDDEMPF